MRTAAAIATAAAGALVGACSIPEKQLANATPYGCLGQPLPDVAADPVRIFGALRDPYSSDMIGGAAVEGFQVGLGARVFSTTSAADGSFSQSQGTGGAPRNAYLRVAPNGYVPTYYFPAVPIVGDLQVEIQLFMASELMTLASAAGVTVDPTKAAFAVTVNNCRGEPVGGATVSTVPAGDVRYIDATLTPSSTATATDSVTGTALIANVPVSNTTINATVGGMALRSHSIDAMAGALYQTEIQP
jgi:hypothetical protein